MRAGLMAAALQQHAAMHWYTPMPEATAIGMYSLPTLGASTSSGQPSMERCTTTYLQVPLEATMACLNTKSLSFVCERHVELRLAPRNPLAYMIAKAPARSSSVHIPEPRRCPLATVPHHDVWPNDYL